MRTWYCAADDAWGWDAVEASTAARAARRYALASDYVVDRTMYAHIAVLSDKYTPSPGGPPHPRANWYTVRLDPQPPACVRRRHSWRFVGDYGHGAGLISVRVCRHCGVRHVRDTWATDPDDGGIMEAVWYEPAAASRQEESYV